MKIEGCIIQKKNIISYSEHLFEARYKNRYIYISDDHDFGHAVSRELIRYNIEVWGDDGLYDVDTVKDLPTIEDAMENALQESCYIIKERRSE